MDIFQFEAFEVYQHHIPCTHKDFVLILDGKLEMGNDLFLEGKAIRRSSNIVTDHYRNYTKSVGLPSKLTDVATASLLLSTVRTGCHNAMQTMIFPSCTIHDLASVCLTESVVGTDFRENSSNNE